MQPPTTDPDTLPYYLVGHVAHTSKWMGLGPYAPGGIQDAARGVATLRHRLTEDGAYPHLDVEVMRVAAVQGVNTPHDAVRRAKAAVAKERKEARA